MNLERARAKQRKLVEQHNRMRDSLDKLLDKVVRKKTALDKARRAIIRGQKRLDVLVAAKTHTGGPTTSPVKELIEANTRLDEVSLTDIDDLTALFN